MADETINKEPLVVEGPIHSDGINKPVMIGDESLDRLLMLHFGTWQVRADGDYLPGEKYRLTIERLA